MLFLRGPIHHESFVYYTHVMVRKGSGYYSAKYMIEYFNTSVTRPE
jgi:hypothetical protein